jgi:hypothetical protein
METRRLIAYSLIVLVAFVLTTIFVIVRRSGRRQRRADNRPIRISVEDE